MANTTVSASVPDVFDDCPAWGPFWRSPLIGAVAYRDSSLDIVVRRTTAGVTGPWSAQVAEGGSAYHLQAFYEGQIPGNPGSKIHLAWVDAVLDQVRYVAYDVSAGTFGTIVSAGALEISTIGEFMLALSVSVDGTIIIAGRNGGAVETWKSVDDGASFSTTSTPYEGGVKDLIRGFPTDTGDDSDTGFAFWDISANELSVKVRDNTDGSFTETLLATGMSDNETLNQYAGWSLDVRRSDGHVFLAAWNSRDDANSDLKVFEITPTSVAAVPFTVRADVLTNTPGAYCCGLIINQSSGRIWVFYARGSNVNTATAIFGKYSDDSGVTWSAEQAVSEGGESAYRFVTAGAMGQAAWGGNSVPLFWDNTADDLLINGVTAVTVNPPQFVLMLAQEATPDVPELDITAQNAANPGQVLTKGERGRDRAVLGEPPRAGAMSTQLTNYKMQRYDVDHPLPGLGLRLNKFIGTDEYNLLTGNIDVPKHSLGNWRDIVSINAFGRLSKLANRKIDTSLYENITVGTAIGHLLDAANFPSGANYRDIDTGTVTLNYWWLSQADALTELNKLVATEGITAEIYEDGYGRLVFRDRNARYTESRSTSAQTTFRSAGSAPWLSEFEYDSGYREIVNKATHPRKTRLADASPSVVWSEAANYLLPPNDSITIYATSSEPFKDAITPVLDTDYNVAWGSVSVSLDRTSGSRVGMTFTAGALGAAFGYNNTTLTAMQLRATSIPQLGTDITEEDSIDSAASVAQYGLRPWSGEIWPDVEWYVVRDVLDAVVTWKQFPRGRIRISVNSLNGTEENLATAERQIGDRVRIIESELGVDAQCWIERVEHEVIAPAEHIAHYECSVIESDLTSNPFDEIDNSVHVFGGSGFDEAHPAPSRLLANVI